MNRFVNRWSFLMGVVAAVSVGCGDSSDDPSSGSGGAGGGATSSTSSTTSTTSSGGAGGDGAGGATTSTVGSGGGTSAPDLTGAFESGCLASPQQDGSTQYLSLTFANTSTDWAVDYVIHGDDACQTDFVTIHIEGPYTITGPSAALDGVWEGEFGFTSKTVTPGSDAAVGFLDSLGSCGTFETGVAKEVLDSGCLPLGQYPKADCSADYDLVSLEGTSLQFGARPADNNMCTPDKRPTELSPVVLTKQ